MLRPARYARAVPKLRVLRSKLLSREAFKDLALSPTMEDAAAILRDTPYQAITAASSPSTIQVEALKVFFSRGHTILKTVPGEAKPIVEAFLREEEAKDVLAILRSVYEGSELPLLPTASIQGTLAWRIRRDPEILISTQRLMEYLSKTWIKPYARQALRLANELRSGEPITWMSLAVSLLEYQHAMERYKGMDRRVIEQILCPYLQYKAAISLINAKILGIQARTLDRILEDLNTCYIAWGAVRGLYEREPGPQELLISLREHLGLLRIDTKKGYREALEEARKSALQLSAEEALAEFAGYPFTPALAVAAMMLAKVEMINVVTVVTALRARIKPDEISEMIIVY